MKCPNDQTTLLITDRSGIEIDYCPECRGVWLDRGELDKIIDKNAAQTPITAPIPEPQRTYDAPRYDEPKRHYTEHHNGYNNGYHKKKRKESFLGDLFDF